MSFNVMRPFKFSACFAIFFLGLFIGPYFSYADFIPTPDMGTIQTNGTVNAIVATSSAVYIGGQFTEIGPSSGFAVPVATSNGTASSSFPFINGTVSAIVKDTSGGWYMGGTFTQVGTVTRNNLAHILANGSIDPNFNPNVNGTVFALALSSDGSTLYTGGAFSTVGGVTYNEVAAISTSNGVASTTFNPNITSSASQVLSLALTPDGSTLYVGGGFNSVGGVTYNELAAINTLNGVASTSFNPNVNGSFTSVNALALSPDGSTIYAGGSFTTVGGVAYNRLAAISRVTASATPAFNPNMNSTVNALALSPDGSTIYAGGSFTTIGGVTYNRLAEITTSNGAAVAGFNPNMGAAVTSLVLSPDGTKIYAGGSFITIGASSVGGIARIATSTGAVDGAFNSNVMASGVGALALSGDGSTLYLGGSFLSVGGVFRNNLAAMDNTGKIVSSFNPNLNGTVNAMALTPDGSKLYFGGGTFTTVGGVTYNKLAAVTTSNGTAISAFNPNVGNNNVLALALSSDTSKLYIGGSFTILGGNSSYHDMGAVNTSDGSLIGAFMPVFNNSPVNSIVLSPDGSTLYAGGAFGTIGGVTYNGLAALNTSTGAASTTFNPNVGSTITVNSIALTADASKLYFGGAFTTVGGVTYNKLAAVTTSNGTAISAFNPNVAGGSPSVAALALSSDGSKLYFGGGFTTIGGVSYNRLAAVTTSNGTAISAFNPNVGPSGVNALALSPDGSKLYIGGTFTSVGVSSYDRIALFSNVNLPTLATSSPTSLTGTSVTLNASSTADVNASTTVQGFNYGITTAYGSIASSTGSFGTGPFSQNLSSLTPGTLYHYQAFATNPAGTATTSDQTFTTSVVASTVTTQAPTILSGTSLTGNGMITATGGINPSVRGVVYGTTAAYGATTTESGSFDTGAYTASITGLTCNTFYHVAAYATNTGGTGYGGDQTVTTFACPVTAAPSITYASAIGGSVSSAALANLLAPGPATTAYLNSLKGTPTSAPTTSYITPPTTVSSTPFTYTLTAGVTDPEVKSLQVFLNTHGFPVSKTGAGSPGHETAYFGPATKTALIKFQKAHGIPGTGFFGPMTKQYILQMMS